MGVYVDSLVTIRPKGVCDLWHFPAGELRAFQSGQQTLLERIGCGLYLPSSAPPSTCSGQKLPRAKRPPPSASPLNWISRELVDTVPRP